MLKFLSRENPVPKILDGLHKFNLSAYTHGTKDVYFIEWGHDRKITVIKKDEATFSIMYTDPHSESDYDDLNVLFLILTDWISSSI